MNRNKMYPTYFAFGALLLYSVLFVLPSILGIGYSFTDWSAFTNEVNFIGLDNFRIIFSGEENYLLFLGNTIKFTFVTTIAKTVIGLGLALLLTKKVFAINFHRTVMYIPGILSPLIAGMVFRSILHPRDGLLNSFLRVFGIEGPRWLSDPNIAFWSVMGVDTWRGIGFIMVILIAGLMAIDTTYYEAADIDGASGWQKFWTITVPLLMPTLMVTTVLNILHGLRVFDIVFALTNGGPGFTTEVLYTSIFREFGIGRYGVGTALSSIMFVVMSGVGFFIIRVMTRNEEVD